jgi:Lon protease-like protein
MMDGLLPLFPLELVLFPHTPLALHIFEERYKEMIGECMARDEEFGIVLARGNGVVRTGCTASVLEVVRRHEDGKFDILTLGGRRFHLNSIHSRRSFLEGAVEYFEDVDLRSTPPEVARAAIASHRELLRLNGAEDEQPDLDHPELSFQLARISTDLDFRQTLLEMRSEAGRMELVAEHLALLLRQRSVGQTMKKVARSNGHGKHLPDLTSPE